MNKARRGLWKCQCICGTIFVKTSSFLITHKDSYTCHCVKDLIGKTFGLLTVIEKAETVDGKPKYKCRCKCGNTKIIYSANLLSNSTTSCGCKIPNKNIDLIGKVFGKLTVRSFVATESKKAKHWLCECSCGKTIIATSSQLHNKKIPKTHCGCSGHNKINNTLLGNIFGELTVISQVKSNRGKKAWECLCSCGNRIISETSVLLSGEKTNCPKCSCGKTEALCINTIKRLTGLEFTKTRKYFSRYNYIEFDGLNEASNIAIEYNGEQHYIFPNFWHKTKEDFIKQYNRDVKKQNYCRENNIKLIIIPYTEQNNLEAFIKLEFSRLNLNNLFLV